MVSLIEKMKQLVAIREGPPLEVCEIESMKPLPKPETMKGVVQVKVLSAGLAFPDLLTIEGKHIFRRKFPFVVCRECSGIVISVGPGVKKFKLGDKIFGACEGAIAGETRIAEKNAHLIPEGVSPYVVSGFEMK